MGINLNVHHCSRLTSSHICHQIGSVNLSPTLNNCQSAFTNDQLIAFSCNAHAHPGDPDQPELKQRSVNDWICRLCRAPIRVEITSQQEIIAIALGQDDGVY
ncbi:MAG: hypothetical protein RI556_02670 [Hydrogenovibrio sp.]|uniref:hypothetical protein n=1 Tax=Hydrogenovibrio sp. TaxID=2065821 RepID=UPI00286FE4D7|nr:hypothetical protein [Hydrogenovibrio sp.]MDR9498053.1 hypothetical protein [Hydrogenovibrio sp.]